MNSQEATRRPLHVWRTSDPIARADRTIPPGRVIARILDKMKYENQFIASYKFSNLHIGGPRRPVFFDISTTRPELLDLDRNYDVIREELLGILPERLAIPRVYKLDQMQFNIAGRPEAGHGRRLPSVILHRTLRPAASPDPRGPRWPPAARWRIRFPCLARFPLSFQVISPGLMRERLEPGPEAGCRPIRIQGSHPTHNSDFPRCTTGIVILRS